MATASCFLLVFLLSNPQQHDMMGLRVASIKVFSANALESKRLRFQTSSSTAACRGSFMRMLPGFMHASEMLMVTIASLSCNLSASVFSSMKAAFIASDTPPNCNFC